jgi:hypothetical protein
VLMRLSFLAGYEVCIIFMEEFCFLVHKAASFVGRQPTFTKNGSSPLSVSKNKRSNKLAQSG